MNSAYKHGSDLAHQTNMFTLQWLKSIQLLLLVIFCSTSDVVCAQESALSPLQLKVVVVKEILSPWGDQEVSAMFLKANKILKQCAISIDVHKTLNIAPVGLPMGYESVSAAHSYYALSGLPVVILLTRTQDDGSAGFSPGSKFLFLAHHSRSEEYVQSHHPDYETLAHELGHMLGDLKHVASESNLMSGYISNQSSELTDEQCEKMRKHTQLSLTTK